MSNESVKALLYKKADDGTLTDEISEEALDTIEAAHAEHVKAAPADTLKAEYDRGHQQGKFEALSKEEDAIRKKYGIESKAKLAVLIDEAISKAAKVEGSDDKVLIHPLYLKLKTESETALESVKSEYETKLADVTTKAERQSRFTNSLSKIDAAMQEAGVVLPKSPAAAAKIKDAFMREFDGFDFDTQETGIYLKDAEGKLLKDKHGHPVKLEDFTKAKAFEWFDIEKQPGRQAPGNDPSAPPTPATWNKDNAPKTQEDFYRQYPTIPADQKQAFMDAFTAASQ